ncbi:MAG TPA: ChaN family lipoprotein [Candidatus Angelobacter sp.]|nr:ChaN family lipoprotein [Candidatus Angelobacter sp.]
MGSVSLIRARRRTAAQQLALKQVKREINATDPHGRLKYLRDFTEAYLDYNKVLSTPELEQQCSSADVLLVGDYHALAASQNFAAELLQTVASAGRPVILALETVFSRDQRMLDRWFRGEISEEQLRTGIRYDEEWGYDWEPFAGLLRSAKQHATGVYGIDSGHRGSMRRIGARDRYAALKISELREKFSGSVVLALFGEAHLAPNHLPRWLRQNRPADRILTVLQNVDELYWKSAGEVMHTLQAVQVSNDIVCVFNSTPLEKYESYRIYIERWRTNPSQPDLAPTFYNVVDSLLRSLGLEQYYPAAGHHPRTLVENYPEVQTGSDQQEFERLLLRRGLDAPERRQALEKLRRNGCVFLPRQNLLLIERFQMAAAAEEAVRFVQSECRGTRPWIGSSAEHQFYFEVMERALVTFGVRVLLPNYPLAREDDLQALCSQPEEVIAEQTGFSHREFTDMVATLLLHKEVVMGRRWSALPCSIAQVLSLSGKKRNFLVQHLGAMLGAEMHEAYLAGVLSKSYLRSLFFRKTHLPGAARKAYLEVARSVNRGS